MNNQFVFFTTYEPRMKIWYHWNLFNLLVDFGSIVYNRVLVDKHQNFLKIVVRVIIIDQWNQLAHLYKIRLTVIYSRAFLVALTSGSL